MSPLLFSMVPDSDIVRHVQQKSQWALGEVIFHQFPDKEWYIKINSEVKNRDLIIVDSLNQPDEKILPLLFFAKTAKTLGAKKIGLIAPYLPYLRQDTCFAPGEGVTSRYFAELLSSSFDWLMTIDPHLHRYHALDEIYSIPNCVLHATGPIIRWITQHVANPVIIGPDEESKQWVADIAHEGGFPYRVLNKIRRGDRNVAISEVLQGSFASSTPVLVDDIISTATTMIEAVARLKQAGAHTIFCVGVHALFAGDAYARLSKLGGVRVVTCNTIVHVSNGIDVSDLIISHIKKL